MAGTRTGGLKCAAKNKELYGSDYYKRIGKIGGAKGHTGGFWADRELARTAGAKGGRKSRRGPSRPEVIYPDKTTVESIEVVTKKPHWRFWQ